MNLRLQIASETEQRLRARAEEQGLTPEAFIQGLLEGALAAEVRPPTAGSETKDNGASGSSVSLQDAGEEQDQPATWRGVFATDHQHETLFTQDLAVPPAGLPRREPNVVLNPRWLDDEP